LISQVNLKELLDKIIGLHFDNHNFSLKGSLVWIPNTKKQKERHFKKFGKELKVNRSKYRIKDIYWEKEVERVKEPEGREYSYSFSHNHLIISNIEEDGVFYIMNDHKVGRMGQTFRYKFQIIDYHKTTNQSDYKIKLLDKTMSMIR
tara:strand:- start:1066 stop:1506 length:441 start_codon:yes stop_codon:yes gene_type:complete